jgi:hypothetical protein
MHIIGTRYALLSFSPSLFDSPSCLVQMEEDDDNFLDGVIEFGDGRQYKIESTENPESHSRPASPARSQISSHSKPEDGQNISSEPVSKEERFADDFDRSWPRSNQTNASITSKESDSSVPSTPAMISPTESKVLFNERSNRLEPYNNAKSQKRGSQMEQPPNDQRMQNGGRPDRGPGRKDTATSAPMTPRGFTGPPTPKDRDFGGADLRGRRLSNMGPPPIPPQKIPPPSVAKDTRPLPPHMSPTITAAEISGRKPSPTPSNRSNRHSSTAGVSPVLASAPLAAVDLDEVTKDTMQSAAARAKARRQQEEEERAKAQERAKKKAQEIQEKMEKERLEKEVAKRTEVTNNFSCFSWRTNSVFRWTVRSRPSSKMPLKTWIQRETHRPQNLVKFLYDGPLRREEVYSSWTQLSALGVNPLRQPMFSLPFLSHRHQNPGEGLQLQLPHQQQHLVLPNPQPGCPRHQPSNSRWLTSARPIWKW